MKRFISFIAIALAIVVSSCSKFDDTDIWNKLNDHEKRIVSLEELCKQMNTNISSLQSIVNALQKNDYITNVSPVRKDGEEIGYTITFAYGDTITIYHGTNGKDGANGKDGYTPQIGVMKDTDGIYYWTVDGEWLLDGKGNKVQANGVNGTDGTNGSNGTDGKDGNDGADGITPRLKIENDYWYVSYDNGATWTELGKATGEDGKDGQDGNDGADGSDGADGEDGDSIFKSVTQDDEYVYFNLADGTMITLPKHDKENIQFEDLQVKAICCKNWDTNNDGELSYAEAAAVTDIGTKFKGSSIIAFNELKYFTGITSLSSRAFYNCKNLWKITLPNNILSFEDGSISGSTTNGFDGYGTFSGTNITNITLPNALKSIGNGAFAYCSQLKYVEFGNQVEKISSYAFYECKSLSGFTIPDSVTEIGKGSFYHCDSLTSVIIPNNVSVIGDSAFCSCDTLCSIDIGNGITIIPNSICSSCPLLTTVTIGRSVKTIEYGAFNNCDRLTSVYCKPTTPPGVYYSQYGGVSIDRISGMKIFVPRESYDTYTSFSTTQEQITSQKNWCLYKSYIQPYDFE